MTDGYQDRIQRVLDHIDRHLSESLCVEDLSRIAAFSRFHFHRQFSALVGVSVLEYVRLQRLKRAGETLAFRFECTITEIALDAGYESPEAFSRTFKRCFGQSPTNFRAAPDWVTWQDLFVCLQEKRRIFMQNLSRTTDIRLVEFDATLVAVLTHRGDPQTLGDTVRRFIAWRKQHGTPPSQSATYNILHDDPSAVPAADFRFDICAAVTKPVAENGHGVVTGEIPAGRYAVLRHTGSTDFAGSTIDALYRDWLPLSGEVLRDYPLFYQRLSFFPDVPEHEALTDIFLPIR